MIREYVQIFSATRFDGSMTSAEEIMSMIPPIEVGTPVVSTVPVKIGECRPHPPAEVAIQVLNSFGNWVLLTVGDYVVLGCGEKLPSLYPEAAFKGRFHLSDQIGPKE